MMDEHSLLIELKPVRSHLEPEATRSCHLLATMGSLLEGKTEWRKSWLYEYASPSLVPPTEAVRTDRWKYIVYFVSDPPVEELYDLKNDPNELNDLSKQAAYANTLDEMRKEMQKLYEDTGYAPWGTHPKAKKERR